MEGKVIVITGATSGIGKAAAHHFAQKGLKVVLAGRRKDKGEELVEEIQDFGGKAFFVPTDVSKEKDVKHLIHEAKKNFGAIHYAFNNAGIEGAGKSIVESEEKDWDEIMGINLKGVWLSMKYQIPELIQVGGGAIVNVSTNIVPRIFPGYGLYSASKAGVELLTKAAAVEYGASKVRVNAIAPGTVDTPMIHRIVSAEGLEKMCEANPLKKIALPEEIAKVAYAICSDAFSHVNGTTLLIDGGSHLI